MGNSSRSTTRGKGIDGTSGTGSYVRRRNRRCSAVAVLRKRKVRVRVQVHGRWSPVREHACAEHKMGREHGSSTATAVNTGLYRKSKGGEVQMKQGDENGPRLHVVYILRRGAAAGIAAC